MWDLLQNVLQKYDNYNLQSCLFNINVYKVYSVAEIAVLQVLKDIIIQA